MEEITVNCGISDDFNDCVVRRAHAGTKVRRRGS